MVDSPSYERYGLDVIQHANSHDHGRVKLWMWSDHGRENGQRQMVRCGEGAPHQPLGTRSSIQRTSEISETPEKQEGNGAFGQRQGSCLPCEGRRDLVSDVKYPNKGDLDLLQRPRYYTEPSLSTRYIANLRADALSRGTETREGEDFQSFWTPTDRSVCIKEIGSDKTYFSLDRRDHHSAGTNALNQPWTFKRMYAFPPPQIIPLILARMMECRGALVLVTPFRSREAWIPELV